MRYLRDWLQVCGLILAVVLPAWGGTRIVVETQITEGDQVRSEREIITLDDGRARIDFLQGAQKKGDKTPYLLTLDGGKSWTLGDLRKGKFFCARLETTAFFSKIGSILLDIEGLVSPEIKDPKVEKLLEEPGPQMLGYPTTHVRLQTTAGGGARIFFKKWEYQIKIVDDVWYTTALEVHPIEQRWTEALTQSGYERLDQLFADWAKNLTGPILRLDSVFEVTDVVKGKTSKRKDSSRVVSLDELSAEQIDPSIFAAPECKEMNKKQFERAAKDLFKEGKLTL
jgi:hypothetical protein